jgi:hypothetical protein
VTSAGPRTALPELLTTSAAKAYRACPRMYRFAYEDLVRPAHVDPNRAFGTLGHHGLEAWWIAAKDPYKAPEELLAAALDAIRAHQATLVEPSSYDLAKADALMIGYHARWVDEVRAQDGQPRYEVLAVEAQFEGPLINPETGVASRTWRAGGKLDVVVRERFTPNGTPSGRVYIVEHKTSSEDVSLGSEYWERLTLDPQVSNYLSGVRWLAPKLGIDPAHVAGVIYDVVAKPALRPLQATPLEARKYTKTTKAEPIPRLYANQRERDETPQEYFDRIAAAIAETPDRYYARGEIVRLEADVREAAQDLWQVGVQIRDARRLKLFPRNPDACRRYGRSCDYLPVCLGVASLDDETRYRRAQRAHEELSADAPRSEQHENPKEVGQSCPTDHPVH